MWYVPKTQKIFQFFFKSMKLRTVKIFFLRFFTENAIGFLTKRYSSIGSTRILELPEPYLYFQKKKILNKAYSVPNLANTSAFYSKKFPKANKSNPE